MAGITFCVYIVAIVVSVVIIVNTVIKLLKDNDWLKNFIFTPRRPKYSCNIEDALDRLHDKELRFQQEEAAKKKADSKPSISKYLNSRITLQDVQDYVKICPPLGQTQCTGCHIVCKDDCSHTCSGKCSTVCNSSCHFACVGVCGGGCSGEATAIGTNIF